MREAKSSSLWSECECWLCVGKLDNCILRWLAYGYNPSSLVSPFPCAVHDKHAEVLISHYLVGAVCSEPASTAWLILAFQHVYLCVCPFFIPLLPQPGFQNQTVMDMTGVDQSLAVLQMHLLPKTMASSDIFGGYWWGLCKEFTIGLGIYLIICVSQSQESLSVTALLPHSSKWAHKFLAPTGRHTTPCI